MNRCLVVLTVVGLAVLLVACGPAATPSPAAQATDTPQAVSPPPTATGLPPAATPTPAAEVAKASPPPTEAFPTPNPNPQCTAVPISSDPSIQPVAANEWSKGPTDAEITLIEYGDFQ